MIDPLFGSIPDTRPNTTVKTDYKERPGKREVCGSSFATNVSTERQQPSGTNPCKIGTAFEKPCLYCQVSHSCYMQQNKNTAKSGTHGVLEVKRLMFWVLKLQPSQ